VPPAPGGEVTVVGQVHLSESRPVAVERRDGRLDTRRISLPRLAPELPYPVYGAYVLLTQQTPANDDAFTRIPIEHEDAWQNGGYAVQWWIFAVMALVIFGWQARKEAHGDAPKKERVDRVAQADRAAAQGDRVAQANRVAASGDRAAQGDRVAASGDRVAPADRAVEAALVVRESD
jgi:hypothetical protein